MLANRLIGLGGTGSLAAYKDADVASKLTQEGALVDVAMTQAATRFVTPLTMRSLTRRPVFVDMFDPASELAEEHVELARRADAVLGGPAGQRPQGPRPAGRDRRHSGRAALRPGA